jgi:hypothetical protein
VIDLVAILHFIGESDDPLVEPGLVQVSLCDRRSPSRAPTASGSTAGWAASEPEPLAEDRARYPSRAAASWR